MIATNNLAAAAVMSAMTIAIRECSTGRGCQRDGSQTAADAARARAEAKRARKNARRSPASEPQP